MKSEKWQHWTILAVMTIIIAIGVLGYIPAKSQAPKVNLASAGLTLEKVEPGIYSLISSIEFPPTDPNKAICNAGIIIGSEGVLVIDPFQNNKLGDLVLQTVAELTDKPVRYVLNTHYHFDHTGGNVSMAAKGIPILGRSPIRDFMLTRNKSQDLTLTPPTVIINSESTLWLGDREVNIERAEGHSGGTDLIAYIPKANVLFAGDILFNERIPYTKDGNIKEWKTSLAELAKTYPTAKVVPGHGPVTNSQSLQTLQEYFEELTQKAQLWQEKGLTQEQALLTSAKISSKYEKYKFQALYPTNLETAYQQLTLKKNE